MVLLFLRARRRFETTPALIRLAVLKEAGEAGRLGGRRLTPGSGADAARAIALITDSLGLTAEGGVQGAGEGEGAGARGGSAGEDHVVRGAPAAAAGANAAEPEMLQGTRSGRGDGREVEFP